MTQVGIETLYNRHRPARFSDIVGQTVAVQTLENAIASGKVASAYLFSGKRGTGKTSTARIFAKALLCDNEQREGADGCGLCRCCTGMDTGDFADFIEVDAASNRGIENIRALISTAQISSSISSRKVFLIDEAHHLTSEAATALLKVLEEPPEGTIFLLATTDPMKLKDTIRSRCQWLRFSPLSQSDITGRLSDVCKTEGVNAESAALRIVAKQSRGGMRDALSMLDMLMSYCGDKDITAEDAEKCFGTVSQSVLLGMCAAMIAGDKMHVFSIPTELADGREGSSLKEILCAFGEVISMAILSCYDAGYPADENGYGREVADMAKSLGSAWGVQRLIRTREIIEKSLWKFDISALNDEDVFIETVVMVMENENGDSENSDANDEASLNARFDELKAKNDKILKTLSALIDLMKTSLAKK